MKAVIELKVNELNKDVIEFLQSLFKGRADAKLTISVEDDDAGYFRILRRSKDDLENGRGLITMTMDELEAYGKSEI